MKLCNNQLKRRRRRAILQGESNTVVCHKIFVCNPAFSKLPAEFKEGLGYLGASFSSSSLMDIHW
jgi:hypothetical protein